MKKVLSVIGVTFGLLFCNSLNAQCTLTITPQDTTVCAGSVISLTAEAIGPGNSLTTTTAAGNNHRGNMFDIAATNAVIINEFDVSPVSSTTIRIYYKVGTYVGYESDSTAWTFIGSSAVTATGSLVPSGIPINVEIPAGQTYAFYVTSSNTSVSLNYSDGTGVGNTYASDANIAFKEGAGMEFPFGAGSAPFTPRVWNGTIHYSLANATTSYVWNTGATTDTIQPTVVSGTNSYSCQVTISGCPVLTDTAHVFTNPIDTTVTVLNETITANDSTATYQWYLCSTMTMIPGATNQSYTATVNGEYAVEITDSLGCSAMSSCFTISSAAIHESNPKQLTTLFPNPAESLLNVVCSQANNTISITDLSGKVVLSSFSADNHCILDISELKPGVYFIQVNSENDIQTERFVKM